MHSMKSYHSSVDMQDLQDQASKYDPYYLSIVVNNSMELDTKIAFVGTVDPVTVSTKFASKFKFSEKVEYLGTLDLEKNSSVENLGIPKLLIDRTAEVIKKSTSNETYPVNYNAYTPGLGVTDFNALDEYYEDEEFSSFSTTRDKKLKQGRKILLRWLNNFFNTNIKELKYMIDRVESVPISTVAYIVNRLIPKFEFLTEDKKTALMFYLTQWNDLPSSSVKKSEIFDYLVERLLANIEEAAETIDEKP